MTKLERFVFWVMAATLCITVPITWATPPSEWNAAWESEPLITDPVSEGAEILRDVKFAVRDRLEAEMDFGQAGPADTGRLREGAARIFVQSAVPSLIGEPDFGAATGIDDKDGSAALDEGRLFHDTDDGRLEAYVSGAWVQATQGLDSAVDLVPNTGIDWTEGGANATKIHGHASRHIDADTAGTDGEEYDYISNTIQQVLSDVTIDNTVIVASTVMDIAHVELDIASRRAGTTKALISCTASFETTAGAADYMLFICPIATPACVNGTAIAGSVQRTHNSTAGSLIYATAHTQVYVTGIAAADNQIFNCRVEPDAEPGTVNQVSMTLIDLGI